MNITKCDLCPNMCGVDRNISVGACGVGSMPRIARAGLHMFEEPLISGTSGSGTIFFSGCNLRCIYCQNYDVSTRAKGYNLSVEDIIEKIKYLESLGANNINFVTPTHYAHVVKEVLTKYKPSVPVVYNTSGYERVEVLKALEGLIDVYLPDIKYFDKSLSKTLSAKENYFEYASNAVYEMYRQVGQPLIDGGLIKKGIIFRHLVLPSHTDDSIQILQFIREKFGDNVWLSLMSQYTPQGKANEYPPLDKPLKKIEYTRVVQYAKRLGFTKCFIQSFDSVGEEFIPIFEGETLY